jgi:RNA polymerase sigma factor (sigma-70 family)
VVAVWRIESARLIGSLARLVRDVGVAEELAQDALVIALEQWPRTGIPDDPHRWLIATAKHRAIDLLRRQERYATKLNLLGRNLEIRQQAVAAELDDALDDHIGDDLLRLIFTAAHPVLSTEAKVALTLRLLGGLTTAEIGRAFLITEPAAAQRIVRAKRTLAAARVRFELPTPQELANRLSSVLEVIYLIFNEGYSATSGDDWTRPGLCHDWSRIAVLYEVLAHLQPSPVVLLNRAVAVGMANHPARGLALLDELAAERVLRRYPQLPAARGELLARLGRPSEACVEFERAAELTRNEGERILFRRRATELADVQ